MAETIQTPLTKLFGIQHPIILAGMNATSGPELVAAVTNAGGLGVFGGLGYTPEMMKESIAEIKRNLTRKGAPFGVDLALPQVGGSARKTNYDYTHGTLPQLIDIIVEEKAALFVSAVGVPPRWAIDKLHAAGIPVMNMIGSPKHVEKALEAGVDILCAQGGEGGGHTGDIATSVLIPKIADMIKGRTSRLNGQPIYLVAAGGIFDGRSLAMALCLGAQAVWVGTRFVAAKEAGAPDRHKEGVVKAGYHDTIRTLIYSGRPLRTLLTDYVKDWEENRADEIKRLCAEGKVPYTADIEKFEKDENADPAELAIKAFPMLMGQVAGAIDEVLPAKVIVENMAREAVECLRENQRKIAKLTQEDMSNRTTDLATAFSVLVPKATPDAALAAASDLLARWSEPHRHYHTVDHLVAALAAVDQLLSLTGADAPPVDRDAICLAAWFHDAVHTGRGGAGEDEAASAVLAEQTLSTLLRVPAARSAEVARLVRLTDHRDPPLDSDLAGQILVDADLSVLALPAPGYRAYADAVRAEYAHVPDAAFRDGRAAILRRLAARPRLFHSPAGHELWEAKARANIAAELAALTS
ncbi:hypothetical protein HK405_011754 [Cladochytrium tenue]|nr:hypothetical protein HK405_011754 [Cladochytrium tenue]